MYDHVCTCYQTSLHCTAHHHCTAPCFFGPFAWNINSHQQRNTFPIVPFPGWIFDESISTPLAPWPDQTSVDEVQPGTQVMDNSWALRSRGARSQRSTQRPGDLACEEEGCTIWGWTWINWINYRETAKGVFSSCFRNRFLKMFEIDISIFHDFSILFISPLIWCNDCAATMSPWRMWIHSSWAKLQESFFDP